MEIRSFLAFELPKEIKRILSRVSEDMKNHLLDVKWVKVENIHLTVIFIGAIQTDDLNLMTHDILQACHDFGPFDIALNGMGVFSSKRNPRVLWTGLSGDMAEMADFRDSLQKRLYPFGIKIEKRQFKPHLTLGRFRKGAKSSVHVEELLSKYQNLTSAKVRLQELALFKSDLKPSGAVYTKLNSFTLGSMALT